MSVPQSRPKPSPDRSRNGAQVTSGTRAGAITGTEVIATTTFGIPDGMTTAVAGTMTVIADGITAETARQNTPPKGGGVLYFASTPTAR